MTVFMSGGNLSVNAMAMPSTICAGAMTQLKSFCYGGSGNYSFSWTGPNGFTSDIQNPAVQPPVTSTYVVTINDGFNTPPTR